MKESGESVLPLKPNDSTISASTTSGTKRQFRIADILGLHDQLPSEDKIDVNNHNSKVIVKAESPIHFEPLDLSYPATQSNTSPRKSESSVKRARTALKRASLVSLKRTDRQTDHPPDSCRRKGGQNNLSIAPEKSRRNAVSTTELCKRFMAWRIGPIYQNSKGSKKGNPVETNSSSTASTPLSSPMSSVTSPTEGGQTSLNGTQSPQGVIHQPKFDPKTSTPLADSEKRIGVVKAQKRLKSSPSRSSDHLSAPDVPDGVTSSLVGKSRDMMPTVAHRPGTYFEHPVPDVLRMASHSPSFGTASSFGQPPPGWRLIKDPINECFFLAPEMLLYSVSGSHATLCDKLTDPSQSPMSPPSARSSCGRPTVAINPAFTQRLSPYPSPGMPHTTASFRHSSTQTERCLCQTCEEPMTRKPCTEALSLVTLSQPASNYSTLTESTSSAPPSALTSPQCGGRSTPAHCLSRHRRHMSSDSTSSVQSSLLDLVLAARFVHNTDQVAALETDIAGLREELDARSCTELLPNQVSRLCIPWDTDQPCELLESSPGPGGFFGDLMRLTPEELAQVEKTELLLENIRELKRQLNRLNREHRQTPSVTQPRRATMTNGTPGRRSKMATYAQSQQQSSGTYVSPTRDGLSLLSFCAVEQQSRLPLTSASPANGPDSVASTSSPMTMPGPCPSPAPSQMSSLSTKESKMRKKRAASGDVPPPGSPAKIRKRQQSCDCAPSRLPSCESPGSLCPICRRPYRSGAREMSRMWALTVDTGTEKTPRSGLSSVSPRSTASQASPQPRAAKQAARQAVGFAPETGKSKHKKKPANVTNSYGSAPTLSAAVDYHPGEVPSFTSVDWTSRVCPTLSLSSGPEESSLRRQVTSHGAGNRPLWMEEEAKQKMGFVPESARRSVKMEKVELPQILLHEDSNPDDLRPPTPDIRKSDLEINDLSDGIRLLLIQHTHLRAGCLHVHDSPDEVCPVMNPSRAEYGVRLDGDRGQELVLVGWQVLSQAVMEVVPSSMSHLPPDTRVCAYWSDQLAGNLYPGTVVKPEEDEVVARGHVPILFDDGDQKHVSLARVRLLPDNFGFGNLADLASTLSGVDLDLPAVRRRSRSAIDGHNMLQQGHSHPPAPSISCAPSVNHSLTTISATSPLATDQVRTVKAEKVVGYSSYHSPSLSSMRGNTMYQGLSDQQMGKEVGGEGRLETKGLVKEEKAVKQRRQSGAKQKRRRDHDKDTKSKRPKPPPKIVEVNWNFHGKCVRKRNGREYYREVVRDFDNHVISVGDSVEFSSGEEGIAYLGHVRDMYIDPATKMMMIMAAWYYYPGEAGPDGAKAVSQSGAAFMTDHLDANEVRCIIRRVEVKPNYVTFQEHTLARAQRRLEKKDAGAVSKGLLSRRRAIMDDEDASQPEPVQLRTHSVDVDATESSSSDSSSDSSDSDSDSTSSSDSDEEKVYFVAGRYDPKANRVTEWDADLAKELNIS